ncbi:MAG: rhamnulokinase [Verrucomicrobiia bacterium]
MNKYYLACDLGAESGRLMLGNLTDEKLSLEEIHRFPNGPERSGNSLHWNIEKLFAELVNGLKKISSRSLKISSISTDSWGVDYILYDNNGNIMKPVYHYRDSRTAKGVEIAKAKVGWETIFAETGIQFMALNTIYQLASEDKERLKSADKLLLIGDAFNHFLCGIGKAEESLASTTQLYNPITKSWSKKLLNLLELPERIFPKIVPSGTRLGLMKKSLADETGNNQIEVVASCSHDTGAAVAAVPASGKNWAYLSSGTWSLMGVESQTPIINDKCRELNFTNEIGYGGSVRLLKNIIGLWLVQECRREWARQGKEYDYPTLWQMASESPEFVSLINPSDPRFIAPDNMPDKIASFCKETNQPIPNSPGAYVRCCLESLALLYKRTLLMIEELIGNKIERLHIVGGGSRNWLLNQFAANALQIPIYTGPVEATAAGNILVQAIALGDLPSLDAARSIVRNSMQVNVVEPKEKQKWEEAYQKFTKIIG